MFYPNILSKLVKNVKKMYQKVDRCGVDIYSLSAQVCDKTNQQISKLLFWTLERLRVVSHLPAKERHWVDTTRGNQNTHMAWEITSTDGNGLLIVDGI